MKLDCKNIVSLLKISKFLLKESLLRKIFGYLKRTIEINVLTAPMCYQFARTFNQQDFLTLAASYMQCWFTSVVDAPDFMHLEFTSLKKILSYSELNVTSEVEVFKAAITWISFSYTERNGYAKEMFLKIRLPLLNYHYIKNLCYKILLCKNLKLVCLDTLDEMFKNIENFYPKKNSTLYSGRHCSRSLFNILIYGRNLEIGGDFVELTSYTNNKVEKSIKKVKGFYLLENFLDSYLKVNSVLVKGNIFVFSRETKEETHSMSVYKYPLSGGRWEKVAHMYDRRRCYSACAIIDKVYVIGGVGSETMRSCVEFDTAGNKWKEVAGMKEARSRAATALLGEMIVVSGGWGQFGYEGLRTVEMYDYARDTWSDMPKMVHGRMCHSLFSIKDKLFAVGDLKSVEMFDACCNRFVVVRSTPSLSKLYLDMYIKPVWIGENRVVFFLKGGTRLVASYNADENRLCEEWLEKTEDVCYEAVIRIPQL